LERLINQEVLAAGRALIEARANDLARARVQRRRCAEIIAQHLLEALSHAA
jgi:hypothetical protein